MGIPPTKFVIPRIELLCKVYAEFQIVKGDASLSEGTASPITSFVSEKFSSSGDEQIPYVSCDAVCSAQQESSIKSLSSTNVTSLKVPLPENTPGGVFSVKVEFGDNPVNPVHIRAKIGYDRFETRVYYTDYDPYDDIDIYDIPAPTENGSWYSTDRFTVMDTFLAIGPPEIKFVSQETTQEGKVEYKEADYLLPWPVFNLNDTLNTGEQKKYRIEAKLPLSEPVTTKCGLDCLDDCREKITDIPGKIGELHADQLDMVRADDQPDTTRYLLYRSAKPFVFITQTTNLDQAKPDLPDPENTTYIQTNGFAKPFAYAQEKINGKDNPDVQIMCYTVRGATGRWGGQFVEATFPAPMETPIYWYTQLHGVRKEKEQDVKVTFYFLKGLTNNSDASIINMANFPIRFIDKSLNFEICLVDGDDPVPTARILSNPGTDSQGKPIRGTIAISGVQQGDWIGVEAKIDNEVDTERVAVVKNFTWNDLQRLEAQGGQLNFVRQFTGDRLPEEVKSNIIETIKYALKPPGPTSQQAIHRQAIAAELEEKFAKAQYLFSVDAVYKGDLNANVIPEGLRNKFTDNYSLSQAATVDVSRTLNGEWWTVIVDGRRKYSITQKDQNTLNVYLLPGLASLPIPSARAVGDSLELSAHYIEEVHPSYHSPFPDMNHFHIFFSGDTPQNYEDVYETWWRYVIGYTEILYNDGKRFVESEHRKEFLTKYGESCNKLREVFEKVKSGPGPLFLYHTYESLAEGYQRYVDPDGRIKVCYPRKPPVDETYFSHIDPIRNIETLLSDSRPYLIYPVYSNPEKGRVVPVYNSDVLYSWNEYRNKYYPSTFSSQIGFFVTRKGEIIPFCEGYNLIFYKVIMVSDALGETDW